VNPSATDIPSVLLEMQGRFGWTPRARQFEVVSAQPVRRGALYRCKSTDGAEYDLAVKAYHKLPRAALEATYVAASRLTREWPSPNRIKPIPVLGWASDPPCLCMPFVEGISLSEIVRSGGIDSDQELPSLLRRCGEALARCHMQLAPDHPAIARAREDACVDVARISRRLAIRKIDDRLISDGRLSRLFGDFGLHNMRVDPRGTIWIVDPPMGMPYGLIYKDIALFTVGLAGLVQESPVAGHAMSGFREAFLHGYEDVDNVGVFTPVDRWMLRVFEADRMLRRARNLWKAGKHLASLGWAKHLWRARTIVVDLRREVSAELSSM
jgi:hypothetical protein